ncbi:MAG: amidoligase enzyme [PVC group bacterium]|nr:amidoligase enzyme [PVC group bacterium]
MTTELTQNIKNFGIEIECFNVNKSQLAAEMNSRGINTQVQNYNHQVSTSWKIVTDSSINGQNGAEVVSPILNGIDGLEQIKKVCEALNAVGAKVNKSCGLHVHHEASDITPKQMKNLLTFYAKNEKTIDSFMPTSRRENNAYYCQSAWKALSAIESGSRLNDLSRYNKVNLKSFYRQGTIEFRHHSGTLDCRKINNWVKLTAQILTVGKAKKSSNKNPMRKIYFKRALGLMNTETWDFFSNRIKALA